MSDQRIFALRFHRHQESGIVGPGDRRASAAAEVAKEDVALVPAAGDAELVDQRLSLDPHREHNVRLNKTTTSAAVPLAFGPKS